MYTYPHLDSFPSRPPQIIGVVSCAAQEVLISYLFHIQERIFVNPSLPVHPLSLLVSMHLFTTGHPVSLCFCKYVHLYHFQSLLCYTMFVFPFWLVSPCITVSRSVHVSTDGIPFLLWAGRVTVHSVYVPRLPFPFSVDGHLGSFRVLAIINSDAMNLRCIHPFRS